MGSPKDGERYRTNWQGEIDSIHLYTALSRAEKNPKLAKVYEKLASAEARHAQFWEKKMREAGVAVPERSPSFRSRALCFIAARFGAPFVLPIVTTLENADLTSYDNQPESKGTALPGDERSHARVIQAILKGSRGGLEGGALARLEGRHRVIGGNALRAAVLGANDGLVSNLSLIMGVTGAALSENALLITGFAGLLAGAFSMAMGEWLSVQSSRELYARQIEIEKQELEEAPEDEQEELALIYQAKGIAKEEAEKMAASIIRNPESALKTLSREELGIDPESLGGSAWGASLTSFALFAAGAGVPLLPFLLFDGKEAVAASLIFSSAALFFVGALITLFTGRKVVYSGARQLLIGIGAAGITFTIGRLIGGVLLS